MKKNDLTLVDLIANPDNPYILDGWDELDPEEIPEVWWARPLTDEDWTKIARNRA
jgi:hypothetical protein